MGGVIHVAGAGPAGSLAARALARRGRGVLLFDRARFPRDKVCGGCLGPAAVAALEEAGLADLPARLGAVPLRALALHAGGRTARLPLAGGFAVTRRALDHALVEEAVAAGAAFLDGVAVPPKKRPNMTIDATGLGGGRVKARSLLGAGAVYASYDAEPGTIHMAHARDGYVGVTVAEEGRIVVAAALRPRAARRRGVRGAAERVLRDAGRPPLPEGGDWRGTPLLTRRRARPYSDRRLYAGDAAGYVEPFTGEGMAWAMRAGLAVAAVAADGWRDGLGEAWRARRDSLLHPAQRRCRRLTLALRWPGAVPLAVRLLPRFPSMAKSIVRTTAWA